MKKYIFPPGNLDELNEYLIYDVKKVSDIILQSSHIIFYDTCSIRHHSAIPEPEMIFEYIRGKGAVVVLTGMVIEELSSGNGKLTENDKSYIIKMCDAGIKVLLMPEEWMLDIYNECYSSHEFSNRYLANAVKDSVPAYSEIRDWIKNRPDLYDVIMKGETSSKACIFTEFFSGVKSLKKENDDLGEIMIALCSHLVLDLPFDGMRITVLSDDKGAASMFGRIRSRYKDTKNDIYVVTTPKLCWLLNRSYGLDDSKAIEDILVNITSGDRISVSCTEEYDMQPVDRAYSSSELAGLIVNDGTFTVYM